MSNIFALSCLVIWIFTVISTEDCLRDAYGVDYTGDINYTSSGLPCQRWDSQTPHEHKFTNLANASNFCRNPNGDITPWCYTTDPKIKMDHCQVPSCGKC